MTRRRRRRRRWRRRRRRSRRRKKWVHRHSVSSVNDVFKIDF